MARTTSDLVKGILLDDYGARPDGSQPSLTPFIDSANLIINRVATCSVSRGRTLSTDELEMIERWLAAHLYKQSDQATTSRSNLGASASFQGQTGMYLEGTKYGQHALILDYSGCLKAITSRQNVDFFWIGKPPSEQIDYRNRD